MIIFLNLYLISVVLTIISAMLIFYRMSRIMGVGVAEMLKFSSRQMIIIGVIIPIINLLVTIENIHDLLFLNDEEFQEKFIDFK